MAMVNGLVLTKEDRLKVMEFSDATMMKQLENEKGRQLRQEWFEEDPRAEFQLLFDEAARQLKLKIESAAMPWPELTITGRGVELSADGQVMRCPSCRKWDSLPFQEKGGSYKPKTCSSCGAAYTLQQAAERATIILPSKGEGPTWETFLSGEDVNRYHSTPQLWIDTSREGINYKDPKIYEGDKILVRKTGLGIMATLVRERVYFPQVVYFWKKRPDATGDASKYKLQYLLAIISSRLLLWWFYHKTGVTEWKSFPYVTQEIIQQFPIRKINWNDKNQVKLHDEIVALVDQALARKKLIPNGLDWEIENRILDLYGITAQERVGIHDFFRDVHKMRIVRELYPEYSQGDEDKPINIAGKPKPAQRMK